MGQIIEDNIIRMNAFGEAAAAAPEPSWQLRHAAEDKRSKGAKIAAIARTLQIKDG